MGLIMWRLVPKLFASNTTGYSNSALGARSLYSNTTGKYNTAVGTRANYTMSTNDGNTGVGYEALASAQGNYNVAVGFKAFQTGTFDKTIVLNATGEALNPVIGSAPGLWVKPIKLAVLHAKSFIL